MTRIENSYVNGVTNAMKKLAELEKEIASIRESLVKEEIIYVPDCIEFYDCGSLGIKFDCNGILFWSFHNKRFEVYALYGFRKIPKLKLTPCKREDLKVGDFAFGTDYENPDSTEKSKYCLIVNKFEYKYIVDDKDTHTNDICWDYWYKVEVA